MFCCFIVASAMGLCLSGNREINMMMMMNIRQCLYVEQLGTLSIPCCSVHNVYGAAGQCKHARWTETTLLVKVVEKFL